MGVQVGHILVRHPFKHWCMESRTQVIHVLVVRPTQETKDYKGSGMTKLTGAALDRAVSHAMGLKSVNNCEKWGKEMTEFNETERESKVKQQLVKQQPDRLEAGADFERSVLRLVSYRTALRNETIEEVAQHVEKMKGFGNDTISSFAIYIRDMKK